MPSYRPICDTWFLARAKLLNGVKYYGAYPGGFLERARPLVGAHKRSSVLHVCSGHVENYPYPRGKGNQDYTLDLDPELKPDYLQDARDPFPEYSIQNKWDAILIDPPYTEIDAEKYKPGKSVFPKPGQLLKNGIEAVKPGGKVGILHYYSPQPPRGMDVYFVACITVITGFNNKARLFSVYERPF